jgi:hypothetical protein
LDQHDSMNNTMRPFIILYAIPFDFISFRPEERRRRDQAWDLGITEDVTGRQGVASRTIGNSLIFNGASLILSVENEWHGQACV